MLINVLGLIKNFNIFISIIIVVLNSVHLLYLLLVLSRNHGTMINVNIQVYIEKLQINKNFVLKIVWRHRANTLEYL